MTCPVIFAHGLSGSPAGTKATLLQKQFNAVAPMLQTLELPQQVDALVTAMPADRKSVLIGSSLGALAALGAINAAPERVGYLILLAPAFDLVLHRARFAEALVTRPKVMADAPHYARLLPPVGIPCHVVQGMEDDLFTIDKAVAFVQQVVDASLTLVHANHQLEQWGDLIDLVSKAVSAVTART